MEKGTGYQLGTRPGSSEQYSEYKLRVPKNLVKQYNVMCVTAPRPIKLDEVTEANMVRKTRKQAGIEEEVNAKPTFGAGSVYNSERKEEARRKKRGYIEKKIKREDLPYALRLGGKGGKRFTGRKEPEMLEHSAYFIFTQCPDGVFEAIPVQGWYNFAPDINYQTLSADEVEIEFARRSKTLSYFANKYSLKPGEEVEGSVKIQDKDDRGLIIHDDYEGREEDAEFGSSEEEEKSSEKAGTSKSKGKDKKSIFRGKKKAKGSGSDDNSDEEEELENAESKEVDYMSESSSEDEELEMADDPEPEKGAEAKAKDELNIFSDSEEDDEEDEKELNEAGKELKAIMKKETGDDGSSSNDEDEDDEDDDIDNDEKYSKSALFMQGQEGRKKKAKSGSNSGSASNSRSGTPLPAQPDQATDTLSQAASRLKDGKAGTKRPGSRIDQSGSSTPQSKVRKVGHDPKQTGSPVVGPVDDKGRTGTPGSRSGTPTVGSDNGLSINEEAIRKYLMHKPMTTTDLVRKFKTKKTGLTKEQTVSAIASVLKKINPEQEKIDGKLYLSIKTKKS